MHEALPTPDTLAVLGSDWYWEQDAGYRYTKVVIPPGATRGPDVAAFVGRRRWELPGARALNRTWRQHQDDLDGRREFKDLQYVLTAPDGRAQYVSCSGAARFDAAGRFVGYRGTGRDITPEWLERQRLAERQQAAERQLDKLRAELERRVHSRTAALEAATREVETLTYAIAHDLRAPLVSIDVFAHALERQDGDGLSETARGYLQRIRAAAASMNEMTEGLLQLGRLARAPATREEVDLSALAAQAWRTVAAQDPGRAVDVDIAPGLRAHACRAQVMLVLQNLLGNAWKFTGPRPQARVQLGALAPGAQEQVFFVRDNGVGFEPAHADRLFAPFQRLHLQRDFPGTGLGLATVQKVVRLHGGRVWAESAPGQGATFFFSLPLRAGAQAAADAGREAHGA